MNNIFIDAPIGHINNIHWRLRDKTFEKIDFLTLPRCWNTCPNGGWDTARKIHQGDLTNPRIMIEAAEQALSEGYGEVSVLITMSVMVGTNYRTHEIDAGALPADVMYGGKHKCGCCLSYPTSGARTKWRCELCNYYPTSGNGVRACGGGPDAAPGLYGSGNARMEKPFTLGAEYEGDKNTPISKWIISSDFPRAGFHRDVWGNALPCNHYRKRGSIRAVSA